MAKKKVAKPQRQVTRRQLSHWQMERKRQHIIFGVGAFVVAAVVVIVGVGWYINQYQPLHQTVMRVNDTEFDMNYYIKALEYYSINYPSSLAGSLADDVVRVIQNHELARQGALVLGITVSDKAVDQELKSLNSPLSQRYRDFVGAEMLISKLTEEYFDPKVPLSAEHRHIMAMLLENESQTAEVRARLEAGENFTALAKELSLDGYSRFMEGDLGWLPEGLLPGLLGSVTLEEAAFRAEVGVLSQPVYDEAAVKGVGYWLLKVLEREEALEMAHVQVILLGSEAGAQSIMARIEAGEDFAALAEEFSQDDFSRENGGDVGWVNKNIMSPAFQEIVFSAELETLSEPIRDEMVVTKGGYWLIKVVGKEENREIDEETRSSLKAYDLTEWIKAMADDPANSLETFLDDGKKAWAMEYALKNMAAALEESR